MVRRALDGTLAALQAGADGAGLICRQVNDEDDPAWYASQALVRRS
ncbi:hypothetical protein [Streptosporangium sp. NPDC000509]